MSGIAIRFCFSVGANGLYFHNGKVSYAQSVPTTLAAAQKAGKLDNINSISISPEGGWIACFRPESDNNGDRIYIGHSLRPELLACLKSTASSDASQRCSNPLVLIRLGSESQYFIRHRTSISLRLLPPLLRTFRKLQAIGINDHIEEIIFGAKDTALFVFGNGSFVWDLPMNSRAHEILQQHYSRGASLVTAGLSFTDPISYFFYWGDGTAQYSIPDADTRLMDMMIADVDQNHLGLFLLHRSQRSGEVFGVTEVATRLESLTRSMTSYFQLNDLSQRGCPTRAFRLCGLVGWEDGKNRKAMADLATYFQGAGEEIPREGTGNVRAWTEL